MTNPIEIKLLTGQKIAFQVNTDGSGPACFALSMRKCGSSIFNNIIKALSQANEVSFVDVGDTFFLNNVRVADYQNDPALLDLIWPGNIYGGFRDMPLCLRNDEHFRSGPKLLFVRDPRDALVSEYFSNAYSHPLPPVSSESDNVTRLLHSQRAHALASDINDVVKQNALRFAGSLLQYKPLLESPTLKVLRYEDYIFNKADLIRAICSHFGLQCSSALTEITLGWADVRPEKEDPAAFIRKVTPGDHREKLRPATIADLNSKLGPVLELYGYPLA